MCISITSLVEEILEVKILSQDREKLILDALKRGQLKPEEIAAIDTLLQAIASGDVRIESE